MSVRDLNSTNAQLQHALQIATMRVQKIEASIQKIKQMPIKEIIGYKYFCTGNAFFDEASIRFFVEAHDLIDNKKKWNVLRHICTTNDLLLLEGMPQKIDFSFAQKAGILATCSGWESEALQEQDKEYNRLFAYSKELSMLNVYNLEEQYLVSFAKNLQGRDIIKNDDTIVNEVLVLAAASTHSYVPNLFQFLRSAIHYALESEKTCVVKKMHENTMATLKARNANLCTLLNAAEQKICYVVAGILHLPDLNPDEPLLEDTRDFLSNKKYCVLIPSEVIHIYQMQINETNHRISNIKNQIKNGI